MLKVSRVSMVVSNVIPATVGVLSLASRQMSQVAVGSLKSKLSHQEPETQIASMPKRSFPLLEPTDKLRCGGCEKLRCMLAP